MRYFRSRTGRQRSRSRNKNTGIYTRPFRSRTNRQRSRSCSKNDGCTNGLYTLCSYFVLAVVWLIRGIVYLIPQIVYGIWSIVGYHHSEYRNVTHRSLLSVIFDKGAWGEYLIYRHLKKMRGEKRWLFNVYLPREGGRTTEIDVLLIHESGIYVFESKNYAGWIFGTENQKVWTQCLKPSEKARTRKYHFLNPIMQNNLHLRWLRHQIDKSDELPIYSVIVFGMRCRLKSIHLTTGQHAVVTHSNLLRRVTGMAENHQALTAEQINSIYEILYPMTQVGEDVKQKHIQDIEAALQHSLQTEETQTSDTAEANTQDAAEANTQDAVGVDTQEESAIFCEVPVIPYSAKNHRTSPADTGTDARHAAPDDTPLPKETQAPRCPVCGGALVLRTAKKGCNAGDQFWGCKNYPSCHYTAPSDTYSNGLSDTRSTQ